MVSRSGHPATVSHTCTRTAPSAATWMSLTMPSSVMGRWISGSCTPSRRAGYLLGMAGHRREVMASCYEPVSSQDKIKRSLCQNEPWCARPVTPLTSRMASGRDANRSRPLGWLEAPQAYKPNPVLTTSPVVGFKMTGR